VAKGVRDELHVKLDHVLHVTARHVVATPAYPDRSRSARAASNGHRKRSYKMAPVTRLATTRTWRTSSSRSGKETAALGHPAQRIQSQPQSRAFAGVTCSAGSGGDARRR
jgi:hypothetical protein